MDLILKSKRLAEVLHKDHKRRYTHEPYFVHLEEVAGFVREAGLPDEAIAAAWLHDTIEDVGGSEEMIVSELGGSPAAKRIAALVVWLTNEEMFDPVVKALKRADRKELRRNNLKLAPYLVKSIKLADILSNTGSIAAHDPKFAKVYLAEIDALLVSLKGGHSGLWAKAKASVDAAKLALGL